MQLKTGHAKQMAPSLVAQASMSWHRAGALLYHFIVGRPLPPGNGEGYEGSNIIGVRCFAGTDTASTFSSVPPSRTHAAAHSSLHVGPGASHQDALVWLVPVELGSEDGLEPQCPVKWL